MDVKLSVLSSTVCRADCAHRQPIPQKLVRILFGLSLTRILLLAGCMFLAGSITTQMIAQAQTRQQRDESVSVQLMKQSTQLQMNDARIQTLENAVAQDEKDIALIHGLGLAVVSSLGILQLIQMIVGLKNRKQGL